MTEPKEEPSMVVTDLGQWFTDERERARRELGEQQRRSVKRRRRRRKTERKEPKP